MNNANVCAVAKIKKAKLRCRFPLIIIFIVLKAMKERQVKYR